MLKVKRRRKAETERCFAAQVKPGDGPLEFTIPAENGAPVRLIPYHRIAHERYATYWRVKPVRT